MSQQLDPQQLRKRMLVFYFACGVNLLMAIWVLTAGGGQVAGGTLTLVELVFIGFAGVNYYMARRIGKFLRRLGPPPGEQVTK
ncbi:MAG TPA: hypothetical protein VGP15_13770 [Burkholderiales bacterium]|nr:hypothetical protein [Burkholderiales bacterium]